MSAPREMCAVVLWHIRAGC